MLNLQKYTFVKYFFIDTVFHWSVWSLPSERSKLMDVSMWRNVFKDETVAVVSVEDLPGLCLPYCRMRFALKLMMCASLGVFHAVLIALQRGLGYLMVAGRNVFGPKCQHDHLPPNKIGNSSRGGMQRFTGCLSMWGVHLGKYSVVEIHFH